MNAITLNRTIRRKRRVSANIQGTKERPRISVFRSNKYIYAQAIDDKERKTVTSYSSLQLMRNSPKQKMKKTEIARKIGVELAKQLVSKKITKGVFDRNIYSYIGRVKSLADGLREGGLKI